MRYLVTGAAGFLGSALTRELLARGHQVVALDDFSRGRPDRLEGLGPGLEAVEADCRNGYDVSNAAHGCDSIIHLAYVNGTELFYSEPRQVLDVAVRGMVSVLQACENNAIKELLLVSSPEAYENPETLPTPETTRLCIPDPLNMRFSYSSGKLISEVMAAAWQRTGVLDRVMIVRPHSIVGPDGGSHHVVPQLALRMKRLAEEHPTGIIPFPIMGSGQETRSFCFVDDFVNQIMLVLEKAPEGTEIYNIGQCDERTIASLAHRVAACFDREIKIVPGTLPKGSPVRRCPDTTKIRSLGPLPEPVPFEEAIRRTVRWYRGHR